MRTTRPLAAAALAAVLLLPTAARGQASPATALAPVPSQIGAARRVFVSNAGGESYGAETYYRLTRYTGGATRLYEDVYAAVQRWGRLELVGAPAEADIVYTVRFESPIVDVRTARRVVDVESPDEPQHATIRDPRLTLAIVDPKTLITLWTVTEHIEPAHGAESDDAAFDRAAARLVDRVRAITEAPAGLAAMEVDPPSIPPGAVEFRERELRGRHASIGTLIGGLTLGSIAMAHSVSVCHSPSDPRCNGSRLAPLDFGLALAGAGLGALVGWTWPLGDH